MTKVYVIPRRATRHPILLIIFSTTYTVPRTPLHSTSSDRTSRRELEPFNEGYSWSIPCRPEKGDIEHEINLPCTMILQTIIKSLLQHIGPPSLALVLLASDGERSFLMLISVIILQIKRDPFITLSKLKISANYLGCLFLHAQLHAC